MSVLDSQKGVLEEVIGLIRKVLNQEIEIAVDTPLAEVGLDSMKIIQLISNFERHYEVEFEDDDLVVENFVNTGKILQLLTEKYHVGA